MNPQVCQAITTNKSESALVASKFYLLNKLKYLRVQVFQKRYAS